MDTLFQLLLSGVAVGSIYAMIALAYSLIFATTKVLNLAQGELVMIGALISYSAYMTAGLTLVASIFIGIAGVIGAALLIERIAIRPFKDPHRDLGWVLTTIGFSLIMRTGALQVWGGQRLPFPVFKQWQAVTISGMKIELQHLVIIVLALFFLFVFMLIYNKTIIGRAMKAIAFDSDASALIGIRRKPIIVFSFAISGMVAALAGVLVASMVGASASMGMTLGIKGFAGAVLGGLGNLPGAIVGGIVLGVAEVLASGLIWSPLQDIISLLVLIGVLLFLPNGLLGRGIVHRP